MVSRWGETLDLAYAILKEGNLVKMYIDYKPAKQIGDGMVTKSRNWQADIDWADLIIFDYTGYGKIATELRNAGKLVFGGTEYADNLELDRNFGQSELKRHKVKILDYKEFSNTNDAIAYVDEFPNKYVIKPCGEVQDYKQLLFVGNEDDGGDVKRILKAYQKAWGNDLGVFQLQRKVSGVEVAVSAFFNGHEFIKPININFEHKKLFPKELGVSTGEMGTSMLWKDENPIFEATLKKFEKKLAQDHFVGHIDLNSIVNGNGIYPLEFTPRFGFPQIQIQRAGILEPIGKMLYKISNGESFKILTRKGFQVGLHLVVPPFPYEDTKTFNLFSKDAVVVFKKPMKEGVHPMHLKMVNGEWLITGNSGIVMVVTGTGTTMKEAQKLMYNRTSNILVNNSYYRTDIGDRWAEDSDKLWAWNLL
ncbi:MAG: phosphoribosylamine--glycine ligase [Bacteroidales bacterium]|nr:phosphoribosylamine--glycine ligase [Bacteroidales bacterium]